MSGGVPVGPHEVRGQLLKCVWASQRQHVVVAVNRRDLGVGSSSWSLLLNLHRVSASSARELMVSGSSTVLTRRRARWVALTCLQAFVDSGQKRGSGRRIQGGHHELHRLPTSGRLPTFRAGLF